MQTLLNNNLKKKKDSTVYKRWIYYKIEWTIEYRRFIWYLFLHIWIIFLQWTIIISFCTNLNWKCYGYIQSSWNNTFIKGMYMFFTDLYSYFVCKISGRPFLHVKTIFNWYHTLQCILLILSSYLLLRVSSLNNFNCREYLLKTILT